MLTIKSHPVSIMVMCAIGLHLAWAVAIFCDDAALGATGINALHRYVMSPNLLAGMIVACAMLAFLAVLTQRPWIVLLLLPQQVLLMISALGAIDAIWLAQFADGVFRPRAFIFVDQIIYVIAAGGHTAAVIAHAVRAVR